jgi:hypothetical protein
VTPTKKTTQFGSGFTEIKKDQPSSPSTEEGRRLVVAFMAIKDAAVRDALISLIERISRIYDEMK